MVIRGSIWENRSCSPARGDDWSERDSASESQEKFNPSSDSSLPQMVLSEGLSPIPPQASNPRTAA